MSSLRPTTRRGRLALQPLEDRLAPAGVVTVTDAAGAVSLAGDNLDNSVRVFLTTPGHYRIEGLDGTTLNGGTVSTIDLTRLTRLSFTGNGGRDTLTVTNLGPLDGLALDGGADSDTFNVTNLTVTGDVDVASGTQFDQLFFGGQAIVIGGNLRLTGGGTLQGSIFADRVAVGGTLSVDGGSGTAEISCSGDKVEIGRGIDFNNGTGVGFGFFSLSSSGKCVVGRLPTGESVRVTATGFGVINVSGGNVTLTGGIRLTNNSATPATRLGLFSDVVRVGKLPTGESVVVTGGQQLSLSAAKANLAGGIDFAGGSQGSNLDLTAPTGRAAIGKLASGASIRHTGGAGADVMSVGYGALALAGGIDFAPGDGQNVLRFDAPSGSARVGRLATGPSIDFAGGVNADTLALDSGRINLAGGIDFAGGAGNNAIHLGESLKPAGQVFIGTQAGGSSIAYTGGPDTDVLDFIANSVTLAGGIDFAPGNGTNVLESRFSPVFRIGALAGGPSVKFTGGDALDKLDWQSRRSALRGSIEMTGGAGENTFNLRGSTNTIGRTATGESIRFTGGAGEDQVSLEGDLSMAGTVFVGGDAGSDTLRVQGNHIQAGGKVTLDGGPGSDSLAVFPRTLALRQGVAIVGGDGGDFVNLIADGTIHGDVDIRAQSARIGGGDGRVNGLTIQGSLKVTSSGAAASADSITITNVAVAGAFTASLGAGASTLTIDNLSLAGALTVDTNGGNDVVQFERSNVFGNSTVGGAAVIRTGDGTDSVLIGSPNPAPNGGDADSTRVRFRRGLSIDGGAGADTRNAIDTENDFPGGSPTGFGTFETLTT
jgi:hypothetical protein